MRRKVFAVAFSALLFALCSSAQAHQPTKIFRIGYLDASNASGSAVLLDAFRQELRKLGWIEGKSINIEYRFGENKGTTRLPELAADLVRLKIDLIVVTDTPASLAAKTSTSAFCSNETLAIRAVPGPSRSSCRA